VSCVRDAEGGGERSEPPALLRLRLRASLRWTKPEAINVIASPFSERAKQSLIECVGIPFEIASLTAFIRNDGGFTSFAITIRRGLPKRKRSP